MKIKILDASTLGEGVDLTQFNQFGEVEIYQTSTPPEAAERAINADILISAITLDLYQNS